MARFGALPDGANLIDGIVTQTLIQIEDASLPRCLRLARLQGACETLVDPSVGSCPRRRDPFCADDSAREA